MLHSSRNGTHVTLLNTCHTEFHSSRNAGMEPMSHCCHTAAWNTMPFSVAFSQSVHDTSAFMLLFSLYFLLLDLCQWWFLSDRVLNLNLNILLPLFWSTWSKARGKDSATCAGLQNWKWLYLLFCLALLIRSKSAWKGLAIIFPWIVGNAEKKLPTVMIFPNSPPKLGYGPTS